MALFEKKTSDFDEKAMNGSNSLADIDEDLNYEVPPLHLNPNKITDLNRPRRFSVSAESSDDKKVEKPMRKVYKKSSQTIQRIKNSIADVFLFNDLDKEQYRLLIDAMFEKSVKCGDCIIRQGDLGDYFYVIESGIYEVWKKEDNARKSKEKKVFTYLNKGSFGELALMYTGYRQATVKAKTSGVLFAVNRGTFRHITVGCQARKRQKYDAFLRDLQLFQNCRDEFRSCVADIVKTETFYEGNYVIKEGTKYDSQNFKFFIIQSGFAIVTLNNKKKPLRQLGPGSYFGERALLLRLERSANIIVTSKKLECITMDNASFIRLFSYGPVYHKFRMRTRSYILSDDNDENLSDIEDQ